MIALAHEVGLAATTIGGAGIGPWWRLSGVMHPAVAHFPIALLMVAALVESWSVLRRQRKPMPTTLVCLYIGTIAAVVASVLGWANADASGEKGDVFNLHKWLGIAVASAAVLTVAMSLLVRRAKENSNVVWGYRAGVFGAAALVGLVGSLGGKLVHGESYYSDAIAALKAELRAAEQAPDAPKTAIVQAVPQPIEAPVAVVAVEPQPTTAPTVVAAIAPAHAPAPDLAPPSPAAAPSVGFGGGQLDYARDIEPIFQANCVKCHNETKKKGGYRLDAFDRVFAAGDSGKVTVLPGKADESLLVKVIEGKGDFAESVMPPKGTPLTFQQIALIRRWIDEGAKTSAP